MELCVDNLSHCIELKLESFYDIYGAVQFYGTLCRSVDVVTVVLMQVLSIEDCLFILLWQFMKNIDQSQDNTNHGFIQCLVTVVLHWAPTKIIKRWGDTVTQQISRTSTNGGMT